MPGILPPGAPPYVKKSAKTAAKSAAPAGPAAKPLNVSSPVSSLTGGTTVHTPVGDLSLNVRALQNMLVKHGYDVGVDGKLGPQTLSALRDWYKPSDAHDLSPGLASELTRTGPLLGKQNADAWNKRFGTPATRSPVFRTPNASKGGSLDQHGNDVTNQYSQPDAQTVNLTSQQKLVDALAHTNPISGSLANYGTMLDPKMADAIAGAQFDPQIADAKQTLSKDPLQASQNAQDIASWYGAVNKSLGTAATRDAAASKAGVGSIHDAAQALVASLGGSANAGSGDAAAAGENAAGTLAADGAAQDQYNNDIAPIIQSERASQLTNQGNKDENAQRADALALSNLQGQRGDALTQAQMQIIDANNSLAGNRASMLLNIKGQNNQLAQQGYQNSLGLAQAQIAAMMSGLKVQNAQATLNSRVNKGSFGAASPGTLQMVANAVGHHLVDANGNPLPGMTPAKARAVAGQVASVYFPGGGVTPGWVNGVVGSLIPGTGTP